MMGLLVLAAMLQSAGGAPVPQSAATPHFPDGITQIGIYIPNSQLLEWCTSKQIADLRSCDAYISRIVDASGLIDADFPKGPIDVSTANLARVTYDMHMEVVRYIKALPTTTMSSPAARSVYDAIVAQYPYAGPHKHEIPYRPATPVPPAR